MLNARTRSVTARSAAHLRRYTRRIARILLVCTANVCRSPLAAGLLRRRLDERALDAEVRSAGLLEAGRPAEPAAVEVALGRGVDLSGHVSRRLDESELAAVDLVLGMANEHVREAVVLRPDLWPAMYTLKELVRRGDRLGPRDPSLELGAWLGAVGDGREPTELLARSGDDDVADPIGGPPAAFAALGAELDALVDRLVGLAWPASRDAPTPDARLRVRE